MCRTLRELRAVESGRKFDGAVKCEALRERMVAQSMIGVASQYLVDGSGLRAAVTEAKLREPMQSEKEAHELTHMLILVSDVFAVQVQG